MAEEFKFDSSKLDNQIKKFNRELSQDIKSEYRREINDINSDIDARNTEYIIEQRKTSRGFNIDTFRSEIGRNGVLPTHSFILFINTKFIPGIMPEDVDGDGGDILAMRCDTASVPGVNLMLNDTISRFGYGPLTRMPYMAQFNVLNLNFIVDEAAHILKFWDEWMNKVVYHRSGGGHAMDIPAGQGSEQKLKSVVEGTHPYEVGYKKEYAIPQLTLHVYDRKQFKVMEIVFYDAFPIQKNDINLSWAEQDTPMRFQVALTYTDFDVTYSKLVNENVYTTDRANALDDPLDIVVTGQKPQRKQSLVGKLLGNVVKSGADALGESLVRRVSRIKIF